MWRTLRMHIVTNMIDNGFVYLREKASWLAQYLHELVTFPNGKHDDQADSTSRVLNWNQRPAMGASNPGVRPRGGDEAARLLVGGGNCELKQHNVARLRPVCSLCFPTRRSFLFGLLKNLSIRVGALPQIQKLLVFGTGLVCTVLKPIGACELQVSQCA